MEQQDPYPKFTHYGWMLFCPIKIKDPDSECPCIAARWLILEPLLTLASYVQGLVIGLCSIFYEDYEPEFYFKITGKINESD